MKIGILSLKYQNNFGGILQSYALQEILRRLGHEVEIIDFRATIKETVIHRLLFKVTNFLFSGNIIGIIRDKKKEVKKLKGKDSVTFITNNNNFLSTYLNRGEEINEHSIAVYCQQFDCIIVGSDQVWSVTNSSFLTYFFDWDYAGLKIAYAACSVNPHPAFLNSLKVRRLLRLFDSISVRDDLTFSFVYNSIKKEPFIAADPTMLLDFTHFIGCKPINEDYILMYILGDEIDGGNKIAIERIKNQYGNHLKVVSVIIPSVSLAGRNGADIIKDECDPIQWLNLIYHAKFVFTDSFHGCVFSIKFNKPFLGYYRYRKRASRLLDIKKRYGLHNIINCIDNMNDALSKAMIKDSSAINLHIRDSINYINSVL